MCLILLQVAREVVSVAFTMADVKLRVMMSYNRVQIYLTAFKILTITVSFYSFKLTEMSNWLQIHSLSNIDG